MTNGGERGRFTLPDLVEVVVVLAFLGGLALPFYNGLDVAADYLSPGAAFVWQLFYPLAVLVVFAVIYQTALSGGPS